MDTNIASDESRYIAELNGLILRSIVDHAVVTMDADGMITSWNEGAELILGWSEDEIVGRSADVFFTDVDTAEKRPETEMRMAIENGRAEDVRWHVRKNGERFWGSGLMMPLRGHGQDLTKSPIDPNRIGGFVKIFRDRTAEHEASQRVSRLQDRATLAMRRSGTVGVYDYNLITDTIVTDLTCAQLHSVNAERAETGTSIEHFCEGIADADRAAVREAFAASTENGDDLDVTYRVLTNGPRAIWVQSQGSVQRNDDGVPARLTGITVDISEQREHSRMQDARLEFADKVRTMANPVEIAELASRVIGETIYATRVGHGYIEADGDTIDIQADWSVAGHQSLIGRHKYSDFGSLASFLHQAEDVIVDDTFDDPRIDDPQALEALNIRALVNLPLVQNSTLKAVLFVNDALPRKWSEAEITFLGAMFDRTYAAIDKLRFETERNLLAQELAHRMKNILTIAQVVVKQSLRQVPNIQPESDAIIARLGALSKAQDILTRAEDKDADILSVVEATLSPHLPQRDRISISGPSLPLASQQVLGLSLALHELATNAAKYGALSNQTGKIQISWVLGDGKFTFNWTEVDGPAVTAPTQRGFGSTILQRTVGGYFNGTSELLFEERGARFEISGAMTG